MQTNQETMLDRCQNRERRVNLKAKRKRNLVKKAIELSKKLDMRVLIVFQDKDTDKMSVYNSGDKVNGHFNLSAVQEELKRYQTRGLVVNVFDDDNYERMRVPYKMDEKIKLKRMHQSSTNEKDLSDCMSEIQVLKSDQTQTSGKALSTIPEKSLTSLKKVYDLCDEVLQDQGAR